MNKNISTISRRTDQVCRSNSAGNTADARMAIQKHESKVFAADEHSENTRFADEYDRIWLSSECKSPSFSFDYHIPWDVYDLQSNLSSRDKIFSLFQSESSDLALNIQFHFFDGSIVSPIEEASVVLERTLKMVGNEESKENGIQVSFYQCVSSLKGEFDEAGVQVSLLDLDREDSEWISDEVPGLDDLQSDFPSPSYKINLVSSFPSKLVSEVANQGVAVDADEPLFWPLQRKLDWNAEKTWDFIISPRKNVRKIGSCERPQTRRSSNGSRLSEKKMNAKEGLSKTNPVIKSLSKVETSTECKRTDLKKGIRRSTTMPARLNRSFKDPMRKISSNVKRVKEEPVGCKAPTETLKEDLKFLDEVLFSNDDLSIESLIGLNEFDGQEGVDLEFNKDQFLLDEYVYENPSAHLF